MAHSLSEIMNSSFSGADCVTDVSSFASFFRAYLDSTKERFFSIPYERPENVFFLKGESDEDIANRICRGVLVSVGIPSDFGSADNVDWHSNPTYNGYKEWTWQLSRHNDIKLLAHEYIRTGNKEYARCAETLIVSWIDDCPVPGPEIPGNETSTWRTIECGIRMGANWPYIIYALYEEFSDETLFLIASSLIDHGMRLVRNHTHGNWFLMEMNGLGHIAVLFPFLRNAAEWRDFSINAMTEQAEKQFYPDGFQYELTTCYHEVAVNNYQRFLEMLKAFGIKAPDNLLSIMEKATEVNIKIMEGDGCLPDINDGSFTEVSTIIEPKLRLFGNPVFEWAVTGKGAEPPYESVALPYSGFFVFRTGWKKDDIYALFDSAPFGRGHQHEDKLSLLVSNGVHRVITEGGCYAYDDSPMRLHTMSSFSHNVLIVDGMGQNRRKSYEWKDEDIGKLSDLSYGSSDDIDWAEGIYCGPYGEEEEYPARWKRTIYFLRKERVFIVVDRVSSDTEHEYAFLWHVDSERQMIRSHSAIYSDVCLSFTAGGNLSVSRGEMHPVAGFIATGKEQGMYKAVDRLEYRCEAKDIRLVTVISFTGDGAEVKASSSLIGDDILLRLDSKEMILSEKALRI